MKHLVFVFGTLKEGFPNFSTNKGVRLPGSFLTKERYPLYLVGERHSPWMIDKPGEGEQVIGQLFEVDQTTLDAMDGLERVSEPDGYRRISIEVENTEASGQSGIAALAYLKRPEHVIDTEVRQGPFGEYTLEHAALYRQRA